jgi:hypothetical protein
MVIPWLPHLFSVTGNWQRDITGVYAVFCADFKVGPPLFRGTYVQFDRRIKPGDTYEEGFWHLIQHSQREGAPRLPNLRSMERIPWCKPMVENSRRPAVKTWDYEKKLGKIRTYIWLVNYKYVVVLEHKLMGKTKGTPFWGVILITAYYVEGDSSARSLLNRYKNRI